MLAQRPVDLLPYFVSSTQLFDETAATNPEDEVVIFLRQLWSTVNDCDLELARAIALASIQSGDSPLVQEYGGNIIIINCDTSLQGVPAPSLWICPLTLATSTMPSNGVRSLFILGDAVNVRDAPTLESPVIDQITYSIVQQDKNLSHSDDWQSIVLSDGRRGYIASRYVYTLEGNQAVLIKVDQTWQLIDWTKDFE